MKLASLKEGRDGALVVVSPDLQRCLRAEMTLQQALALVRQCLPIDKARLIQQIVPDIEREFQAAPRKSLRGRWSGLDVTGEDIARARREMWGRFSRMAGENE